MKKFFKWVFLILGILVLLVNIPLLLRNIIILLNSIYLTSAEKGVVFGEIIANIGLPALFFIGFFLLREN
ncbi:hypothetical protein JZO66_03225 [Enterococcus sp. DIV0242_7C1]|uniref:VanZ-like domain-containing protein n=1 Tax=Candidatus Enterococcus dunnyi TaxID=1834192 RepID=A0A200JEA6_9ENTE|nr:MULTISPECIES: hypothetical protein [unclassified Enterococcus]MBO0469545.1 hypothetical protein [Enterococcus sp. DIV0242_7C1]OUZ35169.1 hypothetical protein A5889_000645 [Enterococcus sp. 9D6_DIV0238]